MTRGLIRWIKGLMTAYSHTHHGRSITMTSAEERTAIAAERTAFEERLANTLARLKRLDLQGEVMENPREPRSESD